MRAVWCSVGPAPSVRQCVPIDDFKTLPPEPLPAPSAPTLIDVPRDRRAGSTFVATRFAVPERIGKYRVTELIGSGGMGEVYEALQEQPARTVALKVMRANIVSADSLRRFEYEAQLLANLRHPWIAQVYDAGTYLDPDTRAPRPYFVMELIPGARPLSDFADDATLSRSQRLELFIHVCEAIGHAHQRGVIHRDIKPANVLVDNTGSPKVIDFGIARSSDAYSTILDAAGATDTPVRRIIGTLEYMPPEQCSGDPNDLDIRADVYALGATLYELIAGRLPIDLAGTSIHEAIQVIREKLPSPPSVHRAGIDADLDAIILKSLAKDRAKRYDTAVSFADDIRRYMRHEPVAARRIGPAGRITRWARRNRAFATALVIFTLVLSATTITLAAKILIETRRANQNLRDAKENLQTATENLALIRGLFASLRPDELTKGTVNVEHMLDAAVVRMQASPPTLPATEANFREFLSEAYRGMGVYTKAIELQTRVVEIRQQLFPDPSTELAESLHDLGAALWWNGDYDQARVAYSRALDMRRALYPGDHQEIATSMTHLGACALRQGRLAESESLYTEALDMRRRLFSSPGAEIAASLNNLAKCLQARGDLVQAESLFRQAYDMITAVRGESDLQTASAAHNLGLCLVEIDRSEEAIRFFQQAVALRTSRYGATHHLTASARVGLCRARFAATPTPEILSEAVDSLQNLELKLPADHPEIADASTAVGRMYVRQGEFDRAERYFRTALSISKDARRATPWEMARARLNLGQCLLNLGQSEEAESLIRESLDIASAAEAPVGLFESARGTLVTFYESAQRPDDAQRVRLRTQTDQ